MTSIKDSSGRTLLPLASVALRTAGVVTILSALVDMLVLPYPYQLGERDWWIATTAQIVDRGLVPMVGMALLLTAAWVDRIAGADPVERKPWFTFRFWTMLLAGFLGALYLILFFVHLNNVRLSSQDLQGRLDEEIKQADTQIAQVDAQVKAREEQLRSQIQQLTTASDQQINEAVQANIINQEQAQRIREFKQNPASVEPFLQQQVQQAQAQAQQAIAELRQRQQQARERIFNDALKSGLRVGIGSLLLGFGYLYLIVGWISRLGLE